MPNLMDEIDRHTSCCSLYTIMQIDARSSCQQVPNQGKVCSNSRILGGYFLCGTIKGLGLAIGFFFYLVCVVAVTCMRASKFND